MAAVVVMLLAMLVGAFVGAWVFYAGMAVFVAVAGVDVFIDIRDHRRMERERQLG